MVIEIFGLLSQSGGRWKLPASSLSTRMAEDLASDCESPAKVNQKNEVTTPLSLWEFNTRYPPKAQAATPLINRNGP
jgi:hypothetical protein